MTVIPSFGKEVPLSWLFALYLHVGNEGFRSSNTRSLSHSYG